MRTRRDILDKLEIAFTDNTRKFTDQILVTILEVLLDIRDLWKKADDNSHG